MRPNTAIAERQGDLGGEKVQMTFDQNSLAHLMSVLTDLYSDPELAVIREYSTNAYDAQLRAGVVRPIEVVTPNQLSPFFKVKDYGIGMNATDIREIYSQYGASTKRDSDDQVGMLGLGCKSALTYTNSFTVSAVKDGVKTLVVVSRSEDGSGVMEILSEAETTDPNGVEIIVPVKSYNQFEQKAKNFFRFWDEDTVLLNGKPVQRISGRVISDNMLIANGLNQDYVVMGNVPYQISSGFSISNRGYGYQNGVVARVEIGDVSFTPSREALHYTIRTKETIKRLQDEYAAGIKDALQRDVDAAENSKDAVMAYFEWSKILYGSVQRAPKIQYKGKEIPTHVRSRNFLYKMTSSRYAVQEGTGLYLDNMMDVPVIHGFKFNKVASHHREKIRLWSSKTGITSHSVILVDEVPEDYKNWVGEDQLYSWEDEVKIVKKDRPKVVRREKVEYTVYREGTARREDITLDEFPDVEMVLVSAPELKSVDYHWFNTFKELFPDTMIVRIPTTRWAKFERDFGKTQSLRDFLEEKSQDAADLLTEDDKTYMHLDWHARRALPRLDDKKIDDPQLARFIRVTRRDGESNEIKNYKRINSLCSGIHAKQIDVEYKAYSPFIDYPLLSGLGDNKNDVYSHAVIYVNAVYNS
ncbi:rIIA-like protein [Streptomyces phage Annadreamy]|uniref:RIIA-like protein n=2 Tax=Annadreamyvirus annadreamy TaxID=2846392 RepID=A0A345GTH3_9CAUD|nr:RIIA lysis inhibitor [Streptomyces phage Annadreamy]AXG66245.1 rIIA-like protein [Streptomyces phage Annadreamy]QGH79468.1 rIIA-like protein [Streptomyces phage Limpid]